MPKTTSARKKLRRATASAQLKAASPKLAIVPAAEEKKVRGVKLKTVSTLTMGFALLCLGAFMAGRPPVSTAGPTKTIPVRSSLRARHHPEPELQGSGRLNWPRTKAR